MNLSASKGACVNEGCDRESRTIIAGPCRRCYERARSDTYAPMFPVTPLAEYAKRKGVFIPDLPEHELTLERADALCIDVLNAHPYEVYGDFYFNAA